jgi:hypothetical protein
MLKKTNSTLVLTTADTTTTWTICKEVWSVNGSCCRTDALNIAFDAKMKNSFKDGFDKFMGGLKNVGEALSRIEQVLSNKTTVKNRLTMAYTSNSSQFSNLTVDNAIEMLGAVASFKDDVEKFKTDGKGCFNATGDAVGKLLCYGCAAQVNTNTGLVKDDGSTGMTQASCNTLLEKCHSTWHFMHKVGNMMLVVSIINRQLKPANAPPPKPTEKPAFGGLNMSDIMTAFSNCNTSIATLGCTDTHKSVLCKANFNINAPPKKANADNMDATNTAQLPPAGTPLEAPPQNGTNSTNGTQPPPPPPQNGTNSTNGTHPPPPPGNGTNVTRILLLDAPASGRRTLQVTESSGDVAIDSSGADLTKSITTPATTASVESATIDTGLTSSSGTSSTNNTTGSNVGTLKNSYLVFGRVIAVLACLAMLN